MSDSKCYQLLLAKLFQIKGVSYYKMPQKSKKLRVRLSEIVTWGDIILKQKKIIIYETAQYNTLKGKYQQLPAYSVFSLELWY